MDLTGLGAVFDFGSKVLERIFPDPTERLKAQNALAQLQQSGELAKLAADTDILKAQAAIDQEEAKSPNWFIAGWRPFVGWICGLGLFYVSIIEPLARFIAQVYFHYDGKFPAIDTTLTMQVLLGMLGVATMRSIEKVKGAEGNR